MLLLVAPGGLFHAVRCRAAVQSKLAVGKRLWGKSLDADRPSIAHNKAAIAAGAAQQQPAAAAGNVPPTNSNSSVRDSMDACHSVSQQLPTLSESESGSQQLPTLSESGEDTAGSCAALAAAETWLVLE